MDTGRKPQDPRLREKAFVAYQTRQAELAPEGKRIKGPVVLPPKVGRNDLCPCGSGRKYKKCCIDGPMVQQGGNLAPEELSVVRDL